MARSVQEQAASGQSNPAGNRSPPNLEGCGTLHLHLYDLSTDGSAAVGLACRQLLQRLRVQVDREVRHEAAAKSSEGARVRLRLGPVLLRGIRACQRDVWHRRLVGGWEEIPEAHGFRVGSIWQGNEQMLLRDPGGSNPIGGWVGEVMGVNSAGNHRSRHPRRPAAQGRLQVDPEPGRDEPRSLPGQACYFRLGPGTDVMRGPRNARVLGLGRRQGHYGRVPPVLRLTSTTRRSTRRRWAGCCSRISCRAKACSKHHAG